MIDLREKDRLLLCQLIKSSFTIPLEVWAYGSRVNGSNHEGSDLDLVLRSADLTPLDPSELVSFREGLQESNIPILVDVHDWARLPESFHQQILKQYEVLFSSL